jgi:hypothetical protein
MTESNLASQAAQQTMTMNQPAGVSLPSSLLLMARWPADQLESGNIHDLNSCQDIHLIP